MGDRYFYSQPDEDSDDWEIGDRDNNNEQVCVCSSKSKVIRIVRALKSLDKADDKGGRAYEVENLRESLALAEQEATHLGDRLHRSDELMASAGIVLDLLLRAVRDEVAASVPLEAARDRAPFKNIYATVYGLDEVGGDLPKRKRRAKS